MLHESGCQSMTVNGKVMEDNYIRFDELDDVNEITLVM